MVIKEPQLPSDKELGALLGVETLRCGRHCVRANPIHGEPLGSVNVLYWWKAIVTLSGLRFTKKILLCASGAEGERYETTAANANLDVPLLNGWKNFILATPEDVRLAPFTKDPVVELLSAMDLLPFREPVSVTLCSGIHYDFSFATSTLCGCLSFSNPQAAQVVKLESTLISIARKVVANTKKGKSLRDAVAEWGRFTEGLEKI